MAQHMAMADFAEDQEQNWILGHLVTFAASLHPPKDAAESPAPQGWRDIETAPKDGRLP